MIAVLFRLFGIEKTPEKIMYIGEATFCRRP